MPVIHFSYLFPDKSQNAATISFYLHDSELEDGVRETPSNAALGCMDFL